MQVVSRRWLIRGALLLAACLSFATTVAEGRHMLLVDAIRWWWRKVGKEIVLQGLPRTTCQAIGFRYAGFFVTLARSCSKEMFNAQKRCTCAAVLAVKV